MLHHHILCLLLHSCRRLETFVRHWPYRSLDLLRTWMVAVRLYCKFVDLLLLLSKIIFTIFIFKFQLLYAAMNLTTNEMFNYKRYSYLKNARGKYHNPFSRGIIYNLAEFFLCVQPVEPDDLRLLDLG